MKKTLYTALLGSMILSGCVQTIPAGTEVSDITTENAYYNDLDSLETTLKNEVFTLDLIDITDDRNPSSFANEVNDRVIHEYRPEKITMGLMPYLRAMLHKTLQFNKEQETVYLAEYTLKDLHTQILTGDFWSGKFGYFNTNITVDVIIRYKTSKVLLQKTITTSGRAERRVAKGRQPLMNADRKMMLETLNTALKKVALISGLELRQELNGTRKHYDPLKKQEIDKVYQ